MRERSDSDEQKLLSLYLRDIRKFPLLSRDEERELGERIGSGDEEALRRLVESNLRFVVSFAKRYRGLGLPYIELIHEGNLGLIEAARRFDPSRNVRFLTYAGWWIRRSILTALRHRAEPSMPRFARSLEGHARLDVDEEEAPAAKPAEPDESPVRTDASEAPEQWLVPGIRTQSLSDPLGDHEDLELADRLRDETVPTPEEETVRAELILHLKGLIDQLPERDAEVLKLRYGFHGAPPKTLQEIGDALGITRQRVQQIERAALSRLRRLDRARELRAFLN